MSKTFSSKIFIDGGVPQETRETNAILMEKLGRPLDGQTTNPTLIARNLEARIPPTQKLRRAGKNQESGKKITQKHALEEYKHIVQEMSKIIPHGSISIQVFANLKTKAREMLKQARERHRWIPNSSIKLPCTHEGLKTAEIVCREFPINITLVFSQSQAAAVYEATRRAKYPVFISPFVGRLDDRGENGMQVIANILRMFKEYACPEPRFYRGRRVEVLTASVRNLDHLMYALHLKSDIITIPFKVFNEWSDLGFPVPDKDYLYPASIPERQLTDIPYRKDIILGNPWQSYDLSHDLTTKGVTAFWNDWMGLVG